MKIIERRRESVLFEDLKPGDGFSLSADGGDLYVKTHSIEAHLEVEPRNALRLKGSSYSKDVTSPWVTVRISPRYRVYPVPLTLIVGEGT